MIHGSLVSGVAICYISGLDDTGYRKIYKTYMHLGQISDNGKLG